MLEVCGIDGFYGQAQVLFDLSLNVKRGEILGLLGRNGAGKTSLLRAIMGLLPVTRGVIRLAEREISRLPAHRVPGLGIGYVPQGRRLFARMTVAENLEIGLMARRRGPAVRDQVLDIFAPLRPRLQQQAGTLSGGEQQMLAIARALCLEPDIILLDEPTEGLMPMMIARIQEIIQHLRRQGVAVLLVEQRVDAVLAVADRICVMEHGRHRMTADADALRADPEAVRRHVAFASA